MKAAMVYRYATFKGKVLRLELLDAFMLVRSR